MQAARYGSEKSLTPGSENEYTLRSLVKRITPVVLTRRERQRKKSLTRASEIEYTLGSLLSASHR
jgi:hypothetical protein